jgi:hypothetical protein
MRIPQGILNKALMLLVILVAVFFGCTGVHRILRQENTVFIPVSLSVSGSETSPVPDRAEIVMKALSAAYPDRIGPAEFHDGDWAFLLRGKWYYYTEGRILPEEHRSSAAEYSRLPFYSYVTELPPWDSSPERSARIRENNDRRRSNTAPRQPTRRPHYFLDDLWRSRDEEETLERVKEIAFLGHTIQMHYGILKELSLVEERILQEAKTNPEVRAWIDSLGFVYGYNWRNIAGTTTRSYHSYGIAIDLLPQDLSGLATYWLWTAQQNPEWWAVPYSERYHPPDEVIRAFESFGFTWGGKWMAYDTMHFEYRPEILIMHNIPLADTRRDLQ